MSLLRIMCKPCLFLSLLHLLSMLVLIEADNKTVAEKGDNVNKDLIADSYNAFYCEPQHVHLAYGDTIRDVVIMWATKLDCSTTLIYGKTPWNFGTRTSGSKVNFKENNELGLQYLHRVYLKNLDPKTTYFYRPVSDNISSGPFYFKTPEDGLEWSPLFMVYGDLGVHTNTIPYITNEVLTGKYTAILHAGDFAYNLHDDGGKVGDKFMEMIEGFSSKIPYITCPGNHEIDNYTFAQYRYRFSMPKTNWPIPLDKMWFSVDIGPVHLISYSSEVFFTHNEEYVMKQRDWLIQDLTNANKNRDKQPWIIAFGHRPMYCSNIVNDDCSKVDSKVRDGFEDIFYYHGVDIVLQAHEHSYERLLPMYKKVVLSEDYNNPLAPVQIITGAAGSKHGIDPMMQPPYEVWSAFRMANGSLNSFGTLKVDNATHIKWEQRSVITSDLIDSVWIVQENHGPFRRDNLPKNISDEIEDSIKKSGIKPVYLDDKTEKEEIFENDKKQRMYIGIAFGSLFVVAIVIVLVVRSCRRKQRSTRRWETMDFNYGKKFYSAAKNSEKDLDVDNDFEIDMSDGTLPTTKLLADD
ncbi:acid phosphatase type 7 [Patella vulgata]|uniref:acid phosphatase type 7 n=1 Tax=Patella vulgata TaxID=6465 RepID=UPI0021800278|nr:acid phosphatase type 7 [Patella vulgata]